MTDGEIMLIHKYMNNIQRKTHTHTHTHSHTHTHTHTHTNTHTRKQTMYGVVAATGSMLRMNWSPTRPLSSSKLSEGEEEIEVINYTPTKR